MATVAAAREYCKEAGRQRGTARGRTKWSGVRLCCVLAVAITFILAYVGMYARVTDIGYRRAALLAELRRVRLENEALRVEIQALTSPERLSAAAYALGMTQEMQVSFVPTEQPINVASAERNR